MQFNIKSQYFLLKRIMAVRKIQKILFNDYNSKIKLLLSYINDSDNTIKSVRTV